LDEGDAEAVRPAGEHRRRSAETTGSGTQVPGPPTERVRIAGVEAAVAAGLAPGVDSGGLSEDDLNALDEAFPSYEPVGFEPESLDPGGPAFSPRVESRPPSPSVPATLEEMPDWSDPPTGQIPRVLLDGFDDGPGDATRVAPAVRGPVWREREQDWDDEGDLSHLTVEGETLITAESGAPDDADPYDFDFGPRRARGEDGTPPVYGPVPPVEEAPAEVGSDSAWDTWTGSPSGATPAAGDGAAQTDPVTGDIVVGAAVARRPPRRHAARRPARGTAAPRPAPAARGSRQASATAEWGRAEEDNAKRRDVGTRILTGMAISALAVVCFLAGSVATIALSTIVLTVGAAECFSALQRAGYRPATLLGLLGVPTAVVCAYAKGPTALIIVIATFSVATFLWYLTGICREDPFLNIGATIAGFTWIGTLGGFAGLVLAPASYPLRHGVAFFVGAVALTVANEIGAFAAGSRFGKHKLLPRVSPGKSWEGLLGGTVLTLLVAGLVISRMHPWTGSKALLLGIVVCVLAPLGDLAESQFKRSVGLKDAGSLLPAHGGVLDRIDGLLFVLPATYVFLRVIHLS
jgi:CDP-diglyceride synthetase